MILLRSLVFHLFQLLTVIPFSLLCLLWAPLRLHWRYRLTIAWPRMVIAAARLLVGIHHEIRGAHNLPDEPAILLSKHQSTWETLFFPAYFPRELCYVFKRELLLVPFFGWGIGLLRMIHIDRRRSSDAFEQVVAQGAKQLAAGRSIIIFPEGTRTPAGSQGRYRSGGPRLAVRTGAPLVPIAVNSGELWPRKALILRPGLITVSIGPPIRPQGRSAESLSAEVEHWIEAEMRRLSPHLYAEAGRK
ncbi:MAG: 1-acyl-sn-glycerol-3-phosphate acyltransferase [Burkholderiaceae bacterium]|nr:1-acyl-sn-glycerol-3-phosphate acyltransferase [Burkholderiaceae bacterium]